MRAFLHAIISLYITVSFILGNKIEVIEPDDSDIERPCTTDDVSCLRKQFLSHGFCQKLMKKHNRYDPLTTPQGVYEVPLINTTSVTKDESVYGLGTGKVSEFYINKRNDLAVLSIDFTNLEISEQITLYYHRTGEEDLNVTVLDGEELYPAITTTTIITGLKKTKSSTRESHGRFCAEPIYSFGGGTVDDPDAFVLIEEISEKYATGIAKELLEQRAPVYADFYIDNVICNSK